uniref:SRR1-like domain-containing protein n=1 Tax=Panagrolaimus superbus TaxID=310955 RepID=A0A914YEX8_9BILA
MSTRKRAAAAVKSESSTSKKAKTDWRMNVVLRHLYISSDNPINPVLHAGQLFSASFTPNEAYRRRANYSLIRYLPRSKGDNKKFLVEGGIRNIVFDQAVVVVPEEQIIHVSFAECWTNLFRYVQRPEKSRQQKMIFVGIAGAYCCTPSSPLEAADYCILLYYISLSLANFPEDNIYLPDSSFL